MILGPSQMCNSRICLPEPPVLFRRPQHPFIKFLCHLLHTLFIFVFKAKSPTAVDQGVEHKPNCMSHVFHINVALLIPKSGPSDSCLGTNIFWLSTNSLTSSFVFDTFFVLWNSQKYEFVGRWQHLLRNVYPSIGCTRHS